MTFTMVGKLDGNIGQADQLTLAGNLQLQLVGGQRPAASVQLDQLRLVRAPNGWVLPIDEVERTARLAGLDLPGEPPTNWLVPMISLAATAVLLAAVILLVKRLRVDTSG